MKSIKLNHYASEKLKNLTKGKKDTTKVTSIKELSEYLNVDPKTINNWINQKTPIPLDKLDKIQKRLSLTVTDIFGEIPEGYDGSARSPFQRIVALANRTVILKIWAHYQRYIEWLNSRIHSHPYPTHGSFHVFEHDKRCSDQEEYYILVDVILEGSLNQTINNTIFTVSYVLPSHRVRVDYGKITLKNDVIEVQGIFSNGHVDSNITFNKVLFVEKKILFKVITWVSKENREFVIHTTQKNFSIHNHGKIKISENRIVSQDGIVFFRKSNWHEKQI